MPNTNKVLKTIGKICSYGTVLGSAAFAMIQHPTDFSVSFSGVTAALSLGLINNVARIAGGFVGGGIMSALGTRDDATTYASKNFTLDTNYKTFSENMETAAKTVRGYALTGIYIGGAAALYYAAPHTMEFGRDKLVPLFSKNTRMIEKNSNTMMATNNTGNWNEAVASHQINKLAL